MGNATMPALFLAAARARCLNDDIFCRRAVRTNDVECRLLSAALSGVACLRRPCAFASAHQFAHQSHAAPCQFPCITFCMPPKLSPKRAAHILIFCSTHHSSGALRVHCAGRWRNLHVAVQIIPIPARCSHFGIPPHSAYIARCVCTSQAAGATWTWP